MTVIQPHIDLQSRALAYYLHNHLQVLGHVPKLLGGLAQCVTAWKISGKSSPMVELALASMALAIYSRTYHDLVAATEASSKYSRLLRIVSQRITNLKYLNADESNINECLLAVFLMGRYEGATHQRDTHVSKRTFSDIQSWSHHDGAMAILKLWEDSANYEDASCIIKHTRRGLIRSYFLRNLQIPNWLLDGSKFGEDGLELEYDCMLVRLVNLRHHFAMMQNSEFICIGKLEELENEIVNLDQNFTDWMASIPQSCSYQIHTISEFGQYPRKHFYSPIVYSYSKPGYAASWSQLFATRMLIIYTRMKLYRLGYRGSVTDISHEQKWLECSSQLKSMADRIAYSLPFILERFKLPPSASPINEESTILINKDEIRPYLATLAVWPLTIASSLEGIDSDQQKWFRTELAAVGRIVGDGVLECAETTQWSIV